MCLSVFEQLAHLLAALTAEEYRRPLPLLADATVGQHVRHVVEFYQCLLQGLPTGEVSYDRRPRNPALEQDPQRAAAATSRLADALGQLQPALPLRLTQTHGAPVATNAARELLYCREHAVHHLAIVRIGVHHYFPHVVLPAQLGVAGATLRFRDPPHERPA